MFYGYRRKAEREAFIMPRGCSGCGIYSWVLNCNSLSEPREEFSEEKICKLFPNLAGLQGNKGGLQRQRRRETQRMAILYVALDVFVAVNACTFALENS